MRFCTECGEPLQPGASFCINCGTPVSDAAGAAGNGGSVSSLGAPMPSVSASSAPVPSVPGPSVQGPSGTVPISGVPASGTQQDEFRDLLQAMPHMPSAPAAAESVSVPSPRKKKTVSAVIAAIVVIALVAAGIIFVRYRTQLIPGQAADGTSQSKSTTKSTPKKTETQEPKKFSFDSGKLDSIVKAAQPAVVALGTTDGEAEYASSGADSAEVASGLYLPVYLAVTDNGKTPNNNAVGMLKSMNNDTANALIDEVGGLDAVNAWLKKNDFQHTELQRHYGDTAASAEGKENTATAEDAANMLLVMDRIDAAKYMRLDTQSEGITVPPSMTVYGHRGQGVGGVYNYFLVVKDGDKTVALAVMTQKSKEEAAKLVSDLLGEIHQETNPSGEGTGGENGDAQNKDSQSDAGSGKATPVQLTQSYTTQYGTKNAVTLPALTFQYPSDWTITSNDVNQYNETVQLSNSRGVTLSYVYGTFGGCGRAPWHGDITKVADAQFNAPGVQANAYNLGPFMVASFGGDMYALVPESMQGGHDFTGLPQCVLAFDWPNSHATSFVVSNNQGGLTDQERKEVIAILASLKG